jgi:hypothetical protein
MRSGYSDDLDQQDMAMWRGRVRSAIRGKRGQKLLRDALASLDAMPEKRLARNEIIAGDGDVCLLGAAGKAKSLPGIEAVDPEDHDLLGEMFDVAPCLIQEIEYQNDEGSYRPETPEQRFERMRKWLVANIAPAVGPQPTA